MDQSRSQKIPTNENAGTTFVLISLNRSNVMKRPRSTILAYACVINQDLTLVFLMAWPYLVADE